MTVALAEPTLSVLADKAQREHGLALQAGESMLLHAIQSGEALLSAQRQVEDGSWGLWLKENFPASDRTAKLYMRLARGRDVVLASGVKNLTAAEQLVPALSPGLHRQRPNVEQEEAEARELRRGGASFQAIADHFGIAHQTAQAWVLPDFRDRRNRRLKEERRLAREAKEGKAAKRVVRKAGAALSELYANCERMQDVLAQARHEVDDPDASRSLAAAEKHYREMRDAVTRAVGRAA
jgi:hypothetical protein